MRVLWFSPPIEDGPGAAEHGAEPLRRLLCASRPGSTVDVVTTPLVADARLSGAPATGDSPYDVVLAEIAPGDDSGLALIAAIRADARPVAVVALISATAPESAMAALRAGAGDYLLAEGDFLGRAPTVFSTSLHSFRTAGRALRVLYAVDDPAAAAHTVRHLAHHAPHIQVVVAPDTRALQAALPAKEPPAHDVLLIDYAAPHHRALDVLKLLHDQQRLTIPAVVLAPEGAGDIARYAFRFGASSFLVKAPDHLFQLTATLEVAHQRALRRAEPPAQKEGFSFRVLNALKDSIAVVDGRGVILAVNEAWSQFALENEGTRETVFEIGADYLAACRAGPNAGGEASAVEAIVGIRSVLDGSVGDGPAPVFEMEYPCNSPTQPRWFAMAVTPLPGPAGGAVIAHRDITAFRVRGETLRENESLHRAVERIGHSGGWIWDIRESTTQWSEELLRIFGLSPASLGASASASFLARVHPDDRARVSDTMSLAVREGTGLDLEYRAVRPDGQVIVLHARAEVETDEHGPVRVIGSSRDITEQRMREDALRLLSTGLAEATGRAWFEEVASHVARLAGAEIGFVGRLVTPRAQRIRTIGLHIDGRPMPSLELTPPGQPTGNPKQPVLFPAEVQTIDPVLGVLGVSGYAAVPLFSVDGNVLGYLGVMSRGRLPRPDDVVALLQLFTARVAGEIERQESAAKFRDLFECSPDATLIAGQDGLITMANRQATALFGYAHDELIGLSVEALMPEDGRRAHVAHRAHFRSVTEPRRMGSRVAPLWAQRRDGSRFPVDIGLSPMQSDDGQVVIAAIRDVSDQVRAEVNRGQLEVQLREARKMEAVGTLAGGIAHDFNNLLAVVLVNVEIALEDLGEGHPAAGSLEDIQMAAQRGAELVRQILTFSRQQPANRAVVSLRPMFEEAVKLVRAELGAEIEITLRVDGDTPTVLADTTDLRTAIRSLSKNAADALEGRPGNITLVLENAVFDAASPPPGAEMKLGRYARIVVRDNADGMSPATLERVFEPFFTTKDVGKGVGLGLSMVHGVVRAHEGNITVESRPNEGTTFTIYLPAAN